MTLKDAQTELARELAMRSRKYPEWVQAGLLSKEVAERQFARLKFALLLFEHMTEKEFQELSQRTNEPKKKLQLELKL